MKNYQTAVVNVFLNYLKILNGFELLNFILKAVTTYFYGFRTLFNFIVGLIIINILTRILTSYFINYIFCGSKKRSTIYLFFMSILSISNILIDCIIVFSFLKAIHVTFRQSILYSSSYVSWLAFIILFLPFLSYFHYKTMVQLYKKKSVINGKNNVNIQEIKCFKIGKVFSVFVQSDGSVYSGLTKKINHNVDFKQVIPELTSKIHIIYNLWVIFVCIWYLYVITYKNFVF
eukprot:TRINITY_DN1319_c0_g1_i1.p1 TRINITY_DN1319_c0_g1~~TRINITY_DN1319_c0_g1_i1.p1  ORF type:complete len:245 (-),score=28.93 TRINITY_DN1319_c0_g1_i1:99-794(-)